MPSRLDLPVEIKFGLRLRHILLLFAFWTLLLGLYFRDYTRFSQLDFAVGIFLAGAVLALAAWIRLIYVRSYGSGTLTVSNDRILIDGSRRQDICYLHDCSAFALSKRWQEISWDLAIGGIKVRRSVGGLKGSRAELTNLVRLLNTLAAGADGDTTSSTPQVADVDPRSVQPRFRGQRIGRDGLHPYAVKSVLIAGAVAFAGMFVLVPMLMISAPWDCTEPSAEKCRVVSAVLSILSLNLLWALPLTVLLWRRYRGVARRLRDLDELPTLKAVVLGMIPFTPQRMRVIFEYGTPGRNRFGPAPE